MEAQGKDEADSVKQLKVLFIETKAPYEDKSTKFVIPMNPYDEVYPGIILGNSQLATDLKDLAANRITHLLNCCQGKIFAQVNTDEKFFKESGIKFYGIPAKDVPGFQLSDHFTECTNFIEESLQSGGRIYVHCHQGLSRSSTIVIAFLMLKRGLTVTEAAKTIRTKRPVLPNDGFLKQLCDLDTALSQARPNQVQAPSEGATASDLQVTDTKETTSKPELIAAERPLIFFDLETTGLAKTSDITQIAAVCGDQEFATYVLPNQPIDSGASKVTGLTVIDNILHHHGKPVDSEPISEALPKFIHFLKKFDAPILAAHNGKGFDVPILKNQLDILGLTEEFTASISGCIDTLIIARNIIAKSDLPGGSYRQENLVKTLLGKTYDAHNAIGDVSSLQELYTTKMHLSASELESYLFSIDGTAPPINNSTYRQAKSEPRRDEEQIVECVSGLSKLCLD